MLKFFRRIRQSLVTENRFSKYLLYALGEIFLVVVGILIALQINNWNEERKQRKLEIAILGEIRANLLTDLESHAQNMDFIRERIMISDHFVENLTIDNEFQDSLRAKLWMISEMAPSVKIIITGYNRLQSAGPEIISHDSLRSAISLLYENRYQWLEKTFDLIFNNQTSSLNQDFIRLFTIPEPQSAQVILEPANFPELKRNTSFITALTYHTQLWKFILLRYEMYVIEIRDDVENIEAEMDRLNR